ncbi:hypothetical protein JX265_009236 [Neoarthrinium moseri]|uniref:GH16 domain-containing protein n=1 Tax=Neoarthrinium moseri TaxID=1658444 RepID=A0A9P9WGV9_9PEZI|nr:hypothetical protein JX265_009236 [Neoarthrinium moseri]
MEAGRRLLRPFLGFILLLSHVFADYQIVNDKSCDCYLTNGSTGTYFTTHKFYDFRSMSQHVNVPAVLSDPDAAGQADVSNDYFNSQEWTDAWGIQQWNNSANLDSGDASVLMVNSPSNVYFEKNTESGAQSDTFLTLRTVRLEDFQSSAEFESVPKTYHFASARMYARTVGAPGAITAMFTYRKSDDPNKIQEADLEIRTMDPPDVIQYTNQPSYTRTGDGENFQATRNATVPVGWDDWAVHRMDWSPGSTMWYVDGQNVSQIAYQTPRDPSQVIFNSWSDGAQWSGNMSLGSEAYLQIQWIELIFNSTGNEKTTDPNKHRIRGMRGLYSREDTKGCHNICSVDETKEIGTPVLLQGGASQGRAGNLGLWMPVLAAILLMLL